MDLDTLFTEQFNSKCEGCSILKRRLSEHCILDYEDQEQRDILFVGDYQKMSNGEFTAFRPEEYKIILKELEKFQMGWDDIAFTASVKCPISNAKDIGATDKKICRAHLKDSILQYKPKMIFVCGKLASTMIFGRNVSEARVRGIVQNYEVKDDDGGVIFSTNVCLIFHPWQVVSEPKNRMLFNLDIRQAIDYHYLGLEKKSDFTYEPAITYADLKKHEDEFVYGKSPISIDIETTGLDFLNDTIHTISFSVLPTEWGGEIKTVAIPWDHFEDTADEKTRVYRYWFTKTIVEDYDRIKIFQGGKFDMKFFIREGITKFPRVFDTKIMFFLTDENSPKSLTDLVKYYCHTEM